jgi:hypothetical protein
MIIKLLESWLRKDCANRRTKFILSIGFFQHRRLLNPAGDRGFEVG